MTTPTEEKVENENKMTYIERAIEKAIEGGYKSIIHFKNGNYTLGYEWGGAEDYDLIHKREFQSHFFLDHLFWQSLGKAMGWRGTTYIQMGTKINETCNDWKYYWMLFVDHLAAGKDPESFFEELLKVEEEIKTKE